MKIHIIRVIIVCALLEAPFVCGSRGDVKVCMFICSVAFVLRSTLEMPNVKNIHLLNIMINQQVETIPDPSKPDRPSSLNGDGIKGLANSNTLHSPSNPEIELRRSVSSVYLRGGRPPNAGKIFDDGRQLQGDNIFR